MKNALITSILIIFITGIAFLPCPVSAAEGEWRQAFVDALTEGKKKTKVLAEGQASDQASGLGFTPHETTVLEAAVKTAMELKAPACEAVKIAVDLKYNPYLVIKNVFGYGGEPDLNQLCMCATENGINKKIVAKAAADATSSVGTPVFPRDEIAQTQCLREVGLGYTAAPTRTDLIKSKKKPVVSPKSASSEPT